MSGGFLNLGLRHQANGPNSKPMAQTCAESSDRHINTGARMQVVHCMSGGFLDLGLVLSVGHLIPLRS